MRLFKTPTPFELGMIIAIIGLIGIGVYWGNDVAAEAAEKHCREVQTEFAGFLNSHYIDADSKVWVAQNETQHYQRLAQQSSECFLQSASFADHYDFKHFGLVIKPKPLP